MDVKPAIVWAAAFVAVLAIAYALHLPERMECSGAGRSMSCKHGLLSPELWQRR